MAGLLAWAADVVGGNGPAHTHDEDENKEELATVLFSPEQRQYALELDQKAASLRRSIQELRLRMPPSDISQRLPHLHAHSLASNAALTLQLNAHSSTREQAQLRETTLQEENAAYGKAISNCEKKIQEKLHEADLLQAKLMEMDETEKNLKAELEKVQAVRDVKHVDESLIDIKDSKDAQKYQASRSYILEELEAKRKELNSTEEKVRELEKQWALVQHNSLGQPSPVESKWWDNLQSEEKVLIFLGDEEVDLIFFEEKSINDLLLNLNLPPKFDEEKDTVVALGVLDGVVDNSSVERVMEIEVKFTMMKHDNQMKSLVFCAMAQAEGLASEIHLRKLELEKLNSFQRDLEDGNTEVTTARNRFGKSSSGSRSAGYIADNRLRASHVGGRTESLQRLMLFRSAFVLYILALHILVFIKISF
ncbi:hypothetical protein Scep_019441 [Stephania cephalantha]|uniref:Uncharacterized protein n=1 Tax=Stephania cephalantha TaxID=152367 RepID=A0AAP0NLC9_9MAGN